MKHILYYESPEMYVVYNLHILGWTAHAFIFGLTMKIPSAY